MQVYQLRVSIMGIPNLYRIIEASEHCKLDELHQAIFKAFERFDAHLYSFFITGEDAKSIRKIVQSLEVTHPQAMENVPGFGKEQKSSYKTRLSDLGLQEKDVFHYLFDFGDEWWHRIRVQKISEDPSTKKHVQVVKAVGESPPQYPAFDDEEWEEDL
jgi:hypothetical protein